MRRVVVTGMGIVSSIGNNTQEVLASLYEAKPGITHSEDYAKLGFRSQVFGRPSLNPADVVDRRAMRFLGEGAAWNHVAMEQAIRDAGLEESDIVNPRTGIIMGSGGPSARAIVDAADHAEWSAHGETVTEILVAVDGRNRLPVLNEMAQRSRRPMRIVSQAELLSR